MNKTFESIDILFILLISCYLICFAIIIIYIVWNKKINLNGIIKNKLEKKIIPKKKNKNNSRKTSLPQKTKKTTKKAIKKTKKTNGTKYKTSKKRKNNKKKAK